MSGSRKDKRRPEGVRKGKDKRRPEGVRKGKDKRRPEGVRKGKISEAGRSAAAEGGWNIEQE
ncbi:MAG: hypothetical protein NC389_06610 [Acetatifactor muris]|nr:hypothetical protein [Acetatifactor muris]